MTAPSNEYAYTVGDGDDNVLITMATRHDAVGLKALLERGSDGTAPVEAIRKTWEGDCATLTSMEADA